MFMSGIDPRYPAEFQAGGDAPQYARASSASESVKAAGTSPKTDPILSDEDSIPRLVAAESESISGQKTTISAERIGTTQGEAWAFDGTAPQPLPAKAWVLGLGVTLILLLLAAFTAAVAKLSPSSATIDRNNIVDSIASPWGLLIQAATAPLMVAAISLVGALFFVASRRNLARAKLFRGFVLGLGILTLVLAAALVVLPYFEAGAVIEPKGQATVFTSNLNFSTALKSAPPAFILLGIALIVAIVSIAPIHQQGNDFAARENAFTGAVATEAELAERACANDQSHASYSAMRAFLVAAFVISIGVVSLFAERIFASSMTAINKAPLPTGAEDAYSSVLYVYATEPWPTVLANLSAPMLMAGLLCLAWSVVLAIATAAKKD